LNHNNYHDEKRISTVSKVFSHISGTHCSLTLTSISYQIRATVVSSLFVEMAQWAR
jgi:hypothetical protein